MKRLCITYHMHRNHGTVCDPKMETAETCITLPMRDDIADDILEKGEDSKYMKRMAIGYVSGILSELSEIQGYYYSGFCTAEEVELKSVNFPVNKASATFYPELRNYDADGHFTIPSEVRKGFAITSSQECTCEIIFAVEGKRYYCWLAAKDLNDALGKFFRQHPNITYGMIEEHLIDV